MTDATVHSAATGGRPNRKLLVVDDDDLVVASLRVALPSNWSLTSALSLETIPASEFHAAFIDMHLTGKLDRAEGLDLVAHLKRHTPDLEIVAMSGDFSRTLMEQGLKRGASRFLSKPIGTEELRLTLEKIEALLNLRDDSSHRLDVAPKKLEPRWIGSSAASAAVTRAVASLRREPGPILLEGESGTGKEVVAWLLHRQESENQDRVANGARRVRPYVQVNLAALPESTFESEFFGHVKGAFTGADRDKMGLAEAAQGGDLFLDEIEALPIANQAKLLRFLESGEVRRVGGRESSRIQTRIVVATNRNLQEMVKAGEFREDLLWRINGKTVRLPALRDRKSDIEELARYFVELEKPRRNKQLTDDAIEALMSHEWSGNVRELKRICEQVALYAPLPIIRGEDVRSCLPALNGRSAAADGASFKLDLSMGLAELLSRFEAGVIREALRVAEDVDQAAERIGISRSSMYKKMKDFGIERL